MKRKKKNKLTRRAFLGRSGIAALAAAFGRPPGLQASPNRSQQNNIIDRISSVRIYPAIGVARVGNSKEFFIGPEVIEPPLTKHGESRDLSGALKRQGARFRIYGYDDRGNIVTELTSANSNIKWSVRLANKKSAWYRFIEALDIPESRNLKTPRRNSQITDLNERNKLVIDSGWNTISGVEKKSSPLNLGKFQDQHVDLGELQTDELGRLIVLGGYGKAGSPKNLPIYNEKDEGSFNNADDWYDDISDGPVTATVELGDRKLEALSSWAIVAPPNYAPNVIGWRTMYDLLIDVYHKEKWLPEPKTTSFQNDVLPILSRLSGLQWVNDGFSKLFGSNGKWNFADPELLSKLSDPHSDRKTREEIFKSFRILNEELITSDPDFYSTKKYRVMWPSLYGDSYGTSTIKSKNNSLILDGLRKIHLVRWLNGDFIADYDPQNKGAQKLTDLPIESQPEMLSQAALHYCLADAFHPGCELTWPMRHISMYKPPLPDGEVLLFRIRTNNLKKKNLVDDYGEFLTQVNCLAANGPLHTQGPGDLTKWMAIPWHGDTAFCRSGYEPEIDPSIPSFWPARVPNHVLSYSDYSIATDPNNSIEERKKAFNRRVSWTRNLSGPASDQMKDMTQSFADHGIVEARGIPKSLLLPGMPNIVMVENINFAAPGIARGQPKTYQANPESLMDLPSLLNLLESEMTKKYSHRKVEIQELFLSLRENLESIEQVREAGWNSVREFVEFKIIRMRSRS